MTGADIGAAAGGAVALITAIGAAGKFVWNKIEERFKRIEKALDECNRRSDLSEKRRSVLITIIELLKQEFRHHLPQSDALTRADELMHEYRNLKMADNEKD